MDKKYQHGKILSEQGNEKKQAEGVGAWGGGSTLKFNFPAQALCN